MRIWLFACIISFFGILWGRFMAYIGEKIGDALMHDLGDLCAYLMIAALIVSLIKISKFLKKDRNDG